MIFFKNMQRIMNENNKLHGYNLSKIDTIK